MLSKMLDKLHKGSKNVGVRKGGLVKEAVSVAEGAAASVAFGYVQNKYRDKAEIKGIPADLLVGALTKVVAVAADIYGKVPGWTPHLHSVGNAGINAYFHTLGSGLGGKAAFPEGSKRVMLPPGAALPAGATVLGVIPAAPVGDHLSPADINRLASMK